LKAKPHADVVANLKMLLAKAEAGEIRGLVCFAEVQPAALVTTSAGEYNRPKMIGTMEIAKTRVALELLNESEDLECR
jgi:hypothetical protein